MPILCRHRRFASRRLTYLIFILAIFGFTFYTLAPHATFAPTPESVETGAVDTNVTDTTIAQKNIADVKEIIKEQKGKVKKLGESITKKVSGWNPFKAPTHPPPIRSQDSYKGSSWWADWKWLSVPFSSSFTLDEDRALLPPLRERPFIYCYYDSTLKKSREEKDAESDLLLTWRRAWWSKGFQPTILGASEAMDNPIYAELQRLEMDPDLKNDVMRWLAWDNMGTGILSDYTLYPMGQDEDPLLTFLRRGEYPSLTRWQDPREPCSSLS